MDANGWPTVPLAEVYEFGSGLSKPRSEFGFGYGFLSFKDVFDNYFVPEQLTQLVNSTQEEREVCSIRRGDVFLTRTSETMDELGMSCVALKDYEGATFNGFTKRLRPKPSSRVVPEYAAYYFRSPRFRRDVTAMSTLSTRASLNNEMLSRLSMVVPPNLVQHSIGSILKTLDDKIELNRRMNATLEAMARALFQSWFVDFDPVRAKLDGRQPAGLDPVTAALFPNEFEDSELGHIPKGWEVVPLENLASVRGGKQLPTEECLPVGKFTVFGANGIMGYASEPTHEGFVIAFGRVGAYCGSIHWSLDGAWINNNASAVVPSQWPTFVLQTMLNIDFNSMRTGSAQPFIPNSSLASAKVLRPSPEIAEAFSCTVQPLRRQQADNDKQSRTIATLRDALLPKLLSGQLRLKTTA